MLVEDAMYKIVMRNPNLTKEEINDKFLEFVFDTDDEELRRDFYKRCGISYIKDSLQSPDKTV